MNESVVSPADEAGSGPNGEHTITLDLREDLRGGREPFSRIMAVVARLEAGQDLLLIAPFEPAPLFDALAKQGFQHHSQRTGAGDWQVLFSRANQTPAGIRFGPVAAPGCEGPATLPGEVSDLDARGLEPPQPLVRILEALNTLPFHTELRAHTDRRPMHLYAQLEERGFRGESQEQSDGSFITHIRRR